MKKYEICYEMMGDNEGCPDSYEILSGFCSFHEVEKSRDAEVSQDHYKNRKTTLHRP